MYRLKTAQEKDLDICMQIIREGRDFQQAQGFTQWTEEYPSRSTLQQDIADKKGYVLMAGDSIAAYFCLDFDGEPAYADIDGKWQLDAPYAVVHRMAFSPAFRGKGLSYVIWTLIEAHCKANNVFYIRADTDVPNKRMQHIFEKMGYRQCGSISFQGDGKLAYDKVLGDTPDAK